MAKIFYWAQRTTPFRVGHLAMELCDSDKTYISHWPEKPKKNPLKKRGMAHHTLKEDVTAEKGKPNEIVEIPADVINTKKIKEWWNSMIEEGTNYHLLGENCAQMVLAALKNGDMNLNWSEYEALKDIKLVTPYSVMEWIKKSIPGYQNTFLDKVLALCLGGPKNGLTFESFEYLKSVFGASVLEENFKKYKNISLILLYGYGHFLPLWEIVCKRIRYLFFLSIIFLLSKLGLQYACLSVYLFVCQALPGLPMLLHLIWIIIAAYLKYLYWFICLCSCLLCIFVWYYDIDVIRSKKPFHILKFLNFFSSPNFCIVLFFNYQFIFSYFKMCFVVLTLILLLSFVMDLMLVLYVFKIRTNNNRKKTILRSYVDKFFSFFSFLTILLYLSSLEDMRFMVIFFMLSKLNQEIEKFIVERNDYAVFTRIQTLEFLFAIHKPTSPNQSG